MPFDIIGAKKAGFTDPQIAQEMASKLGFDYKGAKNSGFTDQEIIGEMLSKSDAGVGAPQIDTVAAHTPGKRIIPPKKEKSYLDRVTDPQNVKDYVNYLESPTKPAESVGDWATRVVPESALKTSAAVLTAPYKMVKRITDPVVSNTVDTVTGNKNVRSALAAGTTGALKGVGQNIQDAAVFMGKPLGFAEDQTGKINWSPSNVRDALLTDPVGTALAAAPMVKGAPSAIGDMTAATKTGRAALSATGDIMSTAANKLSPESLYAGSLKMSTGKKLSVEERAARAKTGLDGGYTPTEKGYGRLLDDISDLNSAIGERIKQAGSSGKMVPVDEVVKPLNDIRERAQYDINPQPLLEKIDEIENNLREHPLAKDTPEGKMIPVSAAQQMKIETYRGLKNAYGEMKSGEVEARKAIARGLKEQIVSAVPEIADLNAKDSALINLEKSLSQATKRIANRDISGLGGPMKIAGGALVDVAGGHGLGTLTGAVLWALDNPAVKANLAIALYKARKAAGKTANLNGIKSELSAIGQKLKDERGAVGVDINQSVPDHVQRIIQEPREVPQSVGIATKEQTKNTLQSSLPQGGTVRLTNVDEVRNHILNGKQSVGSSYEGKPGISAQVFDRKKPIVGYGKNNKISAAVVYPESAIIGKGESANEVKIDPNFPVENLMYAIDGYPHLFTHGQLKTIIGK